MSSRPVTQHVVVMSYHVILFQILGTASKVEDGKVGISSSLTTISKPHPLSVVYISAISLA
jgi:hypothetical protein